ncbi:MAG: octanoyltransferase [Oceanospirillaceae bacterium]|nr:octanoyltransferase [Oceanospirillaceae bacterium]HCI03280.1 octanoyltransferase [Oceanospirillaceae bacterium]|tara:strand:- start:568 stop:1200 length:633 start_codon:yes stop_codon:yes gene_type:complete
MTQLRVRYLGLQPYEPSLQAMQDFTDSRDAETVDEIWLLQHEPVFTQGQAGKDEHLLQQTHIPIIKTDRGGQVTYHGPGQLIAYMLIDLKRLGIGVRQLVTLMEEAIIDTLAQWQVTAYGKPDAPGVYVDKAKIASLGLRVRKGCSFHGLALNVDMDLEPFLTINPCGYAGLDMAQLADFADQPTVATVSEQLLHHLTKKLGYTKVEIEE